jgi:hypothetical protein
LREWSGRDEIITITEETGEQFALRTRIVAPGDALPHATQSIVCMGIPQPLEVLLE